MLQIIAPYFGYLASLALIIALLVSTEIKFRFYSIAGNVFFMVYGTVFNAWPVLITNAILFFINIYYLYKLYGHKEDFELISFKGDEQLAQKFLLFYQKDIASYFPGFEPTQIEGNLNFVVLRDLVIANIFSAPVSPEGDAVVIINYTVKKYRDYKIGKFIFEKEKQFLLSHGAKRIVYDKVSNKGHADFLKVAGFERQGDGFVKELKGNG